MAYVNNEIEEDLDEGSGGGALSGAGAPTGAASPSAQAAPASGKQKTSGRFQDLGEYLRVNQGQEFGQKLAGKVGEDIDKGAGTLANAQNQFKERADAATVRDNNNLVGQVGTDPSQINVDDFAKLRDANYQGPKSLSDTQDLYSQVQGAAGTAVSKANASKTEGGRFALLDNYFGKPQYSMGQKSLDNLLVQNDKNSAQAFDQMRTNANQLQQNTQQAGVDLGNYGAQAAGTTQATRQSARGALGIDDAGNYLEGQGALGSQLSQLDERVNQRRGEGSAAYQQALAALQGQGSLSGIDPAILEQYGLPTSGVGYGFGSSSINRPSFLNTGFQTNPFIGLGDSDSLYKVDPSQFLSQVNESDINRGTVANAEQAARLKQLQKLAGMETDLVGNIDQAGTYDDEALTSFNRQGLDAARDTPRAMYSTAANNKAQELEQRFRDGSLTKEAAQGQWQEFMNALKAQYGI